MCTHWQTSEHTYVHTYTCTYVRITCACVCTYNMHCTHRSRLFLPLCNSFKLISTHMRTTTATSTPTLRRSSSISATAAASDLLRIWEASKWTTTVTTAYLHTYKSTYIHMYIYIYWYIQHAVCLSPTHHIRLVSHINSNCNNNRYLKLFLIPSLTHDATQAKLKAAATYQKCRKQRKRTA